MHAAGPSTIGALVHAGTERLREAGSESARLDAELLLGHLLRVERTTLLAHPEALVSEATRAAFEDFLARRASGEPVAYIRGIKEFHGIVLSVDARALIPRPETELIVDLALEKVRWTLTSAPRPPGTRPVLVWDVGTGSGAICVSLAVLMRRLRFAADVRLHASDASADALALALENAVVHGVADLIDFAHGELLEAAPAVGPADLIAANLPYVPSHDVDRLPVAASFEPREALDGGPDGLGVIRRLLAGLPDALAARGEALLEIGSEQVDALAAAVAEALPGWRTAIHDDLTGRPRVARLSRPDA